MQRYRRRALREPSEIGPAVTGTAEAMKQPPMTVVIPRARQVVSITPANLTTVAQRVMEAGEGRQVIEWFNDGPGIAYIGGQDVTAASGRPIYPNQGFVESNGPEAEWWAVSASTSTLRRMVMQ